MKKYLLCHTDGFMNEWEYSNKGAQFATAGVAYEVIHEFESGGAQCYRIIDAEGDEHEFSESHMYTWFNLVFDTEVQLELFLTCTRSRCVTKYDFKNNVHTEGDQIITEGVTYKVSNHMIVEDTMYYNIVVDTGETYTFDEEFVGNHFEKKEVVVNEGN